MGDMTVEGSDISAIIDDELRQAQTFDQSKRTLALEYMRGEMSDLPARVNGSSQTDRTLADNIQWTLPGVVRVFAASDQMVRYEATQPGGEKHAEEASEYTNYSFFRENDGYRILYNATYDSLLFGNGAACSYWCPEESKTKLFKDKTEDELAYLITEEGWTGMGMPAKPGKPIVAEDPMTGGLVEVPTYTVRLRMVTERGQIKDMTLKPENLLINSSATTIEAARLAAYLHDDKTRSDLVEMADEYGWDVEMIDNLPAYNVNTDQTGVAAARNPQVNSKDSPTLKSGDRIDLYECYLRADRDGDGVAELLQVWYAGDAGSGVVLSVDEWDSDTPFTDIPCYPVPHRWEAEGMYDRCADIMRVKTVLLRQLIDNSYAVGMPMQEIEAGSVLNPDILVSPRFGGKIWKKAGSMPIVDHVIPFIGDKLMMSLAYMDEQNSRRTGISKTTMALDPEALQNQTATASQNQRDAGYSQIELIARNMAELGWTKFFAKRRNLAKKYIKQPVSIPSRNGDVQEGQYGSESSKFRTIQPEQWNDDMACTINVGLGTGSRDRDMSMLNLILNGQIGMADRLANMGLKVKALEFIPKIRKTAVEMAESSGLKNPDEYYPEISDEELEQLKQQASQPQPDPALMIEQAKGEIAKEIKQNEGQVTLQVEQGKAEAHLRESQLNSEVQVRREQAQLEADLQTAAAERQIKLEVETVKQQSENARFFAKLQQDRELELLKMGMAERDSSETDENGDPVKKPVDATAAMLMDGLTRLGEMVGGLSASMTAPTEIVRGPDGRAVGTRKVMN